MWDVELGLGISPIPTRSSLSLFRTLGFTELVNVCGTSSKNVYTELEMRGLVCADFPFPDRFTTATSPASIFMSLSAMEMAQLRGAVLKTAEFLRLRRQVMVFCHLGIGRSPAVALMALMLAHHQPVEVAARSILRLRPAAVINDTIMAFANELTHELAHERAPQV